MSCCILCDPCVCYPEISEEEPGGGQADSRRHQGHRRDKRESVVSTVTLASEGYEREFLQRNRDISVTFGYGETGSTQDLRCAERERVSFWGSLNCISIRKLIVPYKIS